MPGMVDARAYRCLDGKARGVMRQEARRTQPPNAGGVSPATGPQLPRIDERACVGAWWYLDLLEVGGSAYGVCLPLLSGRRSRPSRKGQKPSLEDETQWHGPSPPWATTWSALGGETPPVWQTSSAMLRATQRWHPRSFVCLLATTVEEHVSSDKGQWSGMTACHAKPDKSVDHAMSALAYSRWTRMGCCTDRTPVRFELSPNRCGPPSRTASLRFRNATEFRSATAETYWPDPALAHASICFARNENRARKTEEVILRSPWARARKRDARRAACLTIMWRATGLPFDVQALFRKKDRSAATSLSKSHGVPEINTDRARPRIGPHRAKLNEFRAIILASSPQHVGRHRPHTADPKQLAEFGPTIWRTKLATQRPNWPIFRRRIRRPTACRCPPANPPGSCASLAPETFFAEFRGAPEGRGETGPEMRRESPAGRTRPPRVRT